MKKDRTSLSLILSTALHGSVIAFVALGPAFLPGILNSDKSGTATQPVEFTVAANTQTTADLSAPITTPIQPTTPADIQPIRQPIIKPVEAAKVKKVSQKIKPAPSANELSEKMPDKVQPEPALAINENTGDAQTTPTDEITQENTEVTTPVAAAEPTPESTPEPTVEETTPPVVAAAEEQTTEKMEEEIIPDQTESLTESQPEPTPAPVATAEPVANQNASAVSSATQTPSQGQPQTASAGQPQTIEVTQNYLELRQLPGNKAPTYTSEMRLRQLQGRGQLVYYVSRNGQVGDLKLVKSTGSLELDQAAVDAFRKYKFVPGQEGYTVHDFEFVLKGPAEANRARLRTSSK